jgi:hydrogenase maturation factor
VGSASSGAIGPKELDEVKVSGKVLGKFLARVALMDVAATGAYPLLLSITLGVEKNPTGHYIVEGIEKEVRILGIESNNVIMVNTEENFGSKQTGAGVTAIGFANETNLRIGKTKPNDLVVAIGLPRIGAEVLPAEARREIADLKDMMSLAQNHFVHDILPVGAFGIESDARMMAQTIGRQLKLNSECKIDLNKSAGPATVILVTLGKDKLDDITWLYKRPINIIGKID